MSGQRLANYQNINPENGDSYDNIDFLLHSPAMLLSDIKELH